MFAANCAKTSIYSTIVENRDTANSLFNIVQIIPHKVIMAFIHVFYVWMAIIL